MPVVRQSGITTQPASEAYNLVLDGAGATRPARDAVDRRVVQSVWDSTGGIIDSPNDVGGYPTYQNGVPPANGDGYTNVEEYLNGTEPAGA